MCPDIQGEFCGILYSSAGSSYSDPSNMAPLVSEVAERLAEIGDKLELSHQSKKRKSEVSLTVKGLCVIAFCMMLRAII